MRLALTLITVAAVTVSFGQAWKSDYERGLTAGRSGDWTAARVAFQSAVTTRPNDSSEPTPLPGPITERRLWRNGAPYSPNFLAAYSAYQSALTSPDATGRTDLLKLVATELETLLSRNMAGSTAYFLLADTYSRIGESGKRSAMAQKGYNRKWKEDAEIVAPEVTAAVEANSNVSNNGVGAVNPNTASGNGTGTAPVDARAFSNNILPANVTVSPAPILGGTPTISNKFAIVIGNAEGRFPGAKIEFANEDALRLKEELQNYAGYPPENIEVAINATAQGIRAAVKSLAARIPARSTVLLYFTGAGVNVNGQDYLAGVDAESVTDLKNMVPKAEIFTTLVDKEATIFSFFQANRPMVNGRYFGSSYPVIGQIAQTQATQPDGTVSYAIRDGRKIGLYTDAFCAVLREFKSNQIPVNEFAWQVFYRLRRGDNGTVSGSSAQVPTLPVLNQLGANARF